MFNGPECSLSWWMFHVSLKNVCLLLLLGGSITVNEIQSLMALFNYVCVLIWIVICLFLFMVVFASYVWCFAVRCIHIRPIFLENWPLYHYVVPLSLIIFLALVCFVWNSYPLISVTMVSSCTPLLLPCLQETHFK